MGVKALWQIVEPAGELELSIRTLTGKTMAVDLSAWIVEMTQAVSTMPQIYLRTLFFRILEFMKAGVSLVFVVDGRAPKMKQEVMEARQTQQFGSGASTSLDRPWLNNFRVPKCLKLLDCLGIPYIRSTGEAEALCAHLDMLQLVDGVLTDDGDVFCYGAKTVYRNLRKDSKTGTYSCDVYTMDRIQEKLHLSRESLVAMAMLIGCDYDKSGVKFIGKEKAMELRDQLHKKGIDMLDRVCGWRDNKELDAIEKAKGELKKNSHCRKCQHIGKQSDHEKTGCLACETTQACHVTSHVMCTCDWHVTHRHFEEHKLELSLRSKALEKAQFPNLQIKKEFMDGGNHGNVTAAMLEQKPASLRKLTDFMRETFGWSGQKVMQKMSGPLIHLTVRGRQLGDDLKYVPTRIIRECKEHSVLCYEVEWNKPAVDTWSTNTVLTEKIERDLFTKKYQRLATDFQHQVELKKAKKSSPCGRKRKAGTKVDSNQTKITQFAQVKKRPSESTVMTSKLDP